MKLKQNDIVALGIITILLSTAVIFILAKYANTSQVYNEIIYEFTSMDQSNKSLEMNLLFGIIFAGMLLYLIYYIFSTRKAAPAFTEKTEYQQKKAVACALISVAVTYFAVYQGAYALMIGAAIVIVIYAMFDSELIPAAFVGYFLSSYAVLAVIRIFIYLGYEKSFGQNFVTLIGAAISLLPVFVTDKATALKRMSLIAAAVVPFGLLLILLDKYKQMDGTILQIRAAAPVSVTILILIAAFVLEAVFKIKKYWNAADCSVGDIISCGACIVIMNINRFSGTGAIISTDFHHPYENVIGFSQVFELGQSLFSEYIPVSGMYSLVQGAVLYFFGNDEFSNYYCTQNLFYLFIGIFLVWMLKKNIDMVMTLLVSAAMYQIEYNRLAFVLPIMLLLLSPKLMEKKSQWLIVWFITSLFQGLYYPLYGAAVCVAFLPFGIKQLVEYIKEKEYKTDIKTAKFWIGCGACVILFVLCLGCLSGTLRHMLAMGGQEPLADGIARFGSSLPSDFLPQLSNYPGIRYVLYYSLTWILPALLVWIPFACMLKSGRVALRNKKIKISDPEQFCSFAAVVIMPLVCYLYTFVRLDISDIYSRNKGVFVAGAVCLLVLAHRYFKDSTYYLSIVFMAFLFPIVANTSGMNSLNKKLAAYYDVPEGYVYVENDSLDKLGTGYIAQTIYDKLKSMETIYREDENQYLGIFQFGFYYYLDMKGIGTLELSSVKGLSATEEAIDVIRNNHAAVGSSVSSYTNYYLYYWLLSSGEYYWDAQNRRFLPNDGIYTDDEIKEINNMIDISPNGLDLCRNASAMGDSMDTLSDIFTEINLSYSVSKEGLGADLSLGQSVYGDDADFIYLEFDTSSDSYKRIYFDHSQDTVVEQEDMSFLYEHMLKKDYNVGETVKISWSDDAGEEHYMTCNMSRGKLLIPLGAGQKWLLNHHQELHISVSQDGCEIAVPDIVKIQFLKLREAE